MPTKHYIWDHCFEIMSLLAYFFIEGVTSGVIPLLWIWISSRILINSFPRLRPPHLFFILFFWSLHCRKKCQHGCNCHRVYYSGHSFQLQTSCRRKEAPFFNFRSILANPDLSKNQIILNNIEVKGGKKQDRNKKYRKFGVLIKLFA